jgi:RHS repeat-associated protein
MTYLSNEVGRTKRTLSLSTYSRYTLENNQTYVRGIDLDGRIAAYTLGTQSFAIGYDPASRISFISDVGNPPNTNTYGYDELDRLTSAVLPGTPYAYSYDAVGNRTSRTAGTSTHTYDISSSSNRINSITPTSGPIRTFAYDSNGSTEADGQNSYVYDTRGRMKQATSSIGATNYQVNALGQRIRKTNSLGDTVFGYDQGGRLLAEIRATTGEDYLYPMNGVTILPTEGYVRTVADLSWRVVGTGDFDGDGKGDILWRHFISGDNYIYFMNGTTIAAEGYVRTVADMNWKVAGVGDFDGDGRSDIFWRNSSTGETYVYLMNGTTISGEGYAQTVADQSWQVAGIGDFDGDGRSDVLWRNSSSGENYIYFMNGTTIATEGYIRTVADSNWRIAGIGKFDADGKSDIFWHKSTTGETYLYPMDGLTIKPSEGYIRTVSTIGWQVKGIGDLDGDGRSDVVWRNAITGENYLWPMDGLTIKSSEGYFRQVELTWQMAAIRDYDGDGKADIFWRRGQDQQPSREYVYLGDIPVAVFLSESPVPHYIHVDHLNTPRLVANAAGTTVWRWDQAEAFGNNPADENPSGLGAFDLPLRLPGQYYDKETNLHYNYYRDYDPSIGRYEESDPIGLKGGLNTYAYVGGDPLLGTDPLGLAKYCCRYLSSLAGDVSGFGLGFRHCYVVADDGTVYGLYPETVDGKTKGIPRTNDPRDVGGDCFDCPALQCGPDQNSCLRNAHNGYPRGTYRTFPGPNSNTYSATLARGCCQGGVPSGVRDAPGHWSSPPR